MELFDSTNEYYLNSSSVPILPVPKFQWIRKEIINSNIQNPNYIKLAASIFSISSQNRQNLQLSFKQKIISINPFMVKVNNVENDQITQEIKNIKNKAKSIKYSLPRVSPFILNTLIKNYNLSLIKAFNLDLTEQRAYNNPFIHKIDYLDNQLTFFAPNLGCSCQQIILQNLRDNYWTQNINILYCKDLKKQIEFENQCKDLDIQTQQIGNQSYFSLMKSANGLNLANLINQIKNDVGSITLAYIQQIKQIDSFVQWLFMTVLLFNTLKQGGSLIIKSSDISEGSITYLIFICSLAFEEFLIEKSDDNYSLFQYSFHIGCYGFKKDIGYNYGVQLLQNYDLLQQKNVGIFESKIMLHDNDFEKDFTQFNSSLFKYRSNQLQLLRWCNLQLQMGQSSQQIADQIVFDRKDALDKNIKQQMEKSNRNFNYSSYDQHKRQGDHSNQRDGRQQVKVLNQVPQAISFELNMLKSPDNLIRKQKQQIPQQQIQQKDTKEQLEQKERQILAKLLVQPNKPKKNKDK